MSATNSTLEIKKTYTVVLAQELSWRQVNLELCMTNDAEMLLEKDATLGKVERET